MIHPKIEVLFPNDEESIKLFSLICSKIKDTEQLEEFIKWHLDVNEEVVREITKTAKINFGDNLEAKKWATEFLDLYDERIRQMRHTSNQIFQRFHDLKNKEFEDIIRESSDHKDRILGMMQVFLNERELLIGKIIFSYRELWFLAKHILDPKFRIGSISKYEKWASANTVNLERISNSLKIIQKEIKSWKE